MTISPSASATSLSLPSLSFPAPEGTYTQSSIVLPYSELPISGNAAPLATSAGSTTTPSSTSAQATEPAGHSAASTSATPSVAATPSNAVVTGLNAASSSAPTSFAISTLPPSALPASWRKAVGGHVRPSLSTCAIRWGGSADAAAGSNPSAGEKTGGVATGITTGLAVASRRRDKDATASTTSSGAGDAPAAARNARNGESSASHPTEEAFPDPLIEATLVAQGIDAPGSSTTGGVGGILGMSALASYGFLPGHNNLDLNRQLSLVSSSSSSNGPGPSAPYKPSKNVAKPKNGIRQSNSSFVIKAQVHPELKEILSQRDKTPQTREPFVVTQRGRTLLWLSDTSGVKEPLARVLFASAPSAHDVNQLTRSPSTLDVIIGFPTGDILWLDLMTLRYSRINKGGIVTPSGITQIRWLPCATHEGLFVTSHIDGTMMVWDREREDCEAGKGWGPRPWRLALPVDQQQQQQQRRQQQQDDCESAEGEAMEIIQGPASERQQSGRPVYGGRTLSNNSTAGAAGNAASTQTAAFPSHAASPAHTNRWLPGMSLSNSGASQNQGFRNVVEWDPKRSIMVSRPGLVAPSQTPSGTVDTEPLSSSLTPSAERLGLPNASEGTQGQPGTSPTASTNLYGALTPSTVETPGSSHSIPVPVPGRNAGNGAGPQRRRDRDSQLGSGGEDGPGGGSSAANAGLSAAMKWEKNPVTHWKVSRGKVNDFAISPDLGCIAAVDEDGLLKIIDLETERLIASHASYFGAFLSVAWSPDGRFLLTTSCDDLVSLYQPRDAGGMNGSPSSRLVARGIGHSSWVRSVAFDPYRWREGDRTYRFGSVGEDGKVCLWDFSGKSLGRPRGGTGTLGPGGGRRSSLGGDFNRAAFLERLRAGDASNANGADVFHPAPPRSLVPILKPVAVHQVSLPAGWTADSTAQLHNIHNQGATQGQHQSLSSSTSVPAGAASSAATSVSGGLSGAAMINNSTSHNGDHSKKDPPGSTAPLLNIRFRREGFAVLDDRGLVYAWRRPHAKRLVK